MSRNRSAISKFSLLLALLLVLGLTLSVAIAADIRIFSPKNEETVHNNSGNVTVEILARLDAGQRIRLLIDGSSAAPESRDLTFNLEGVERGEHTLRAAVLDSDDEIVAESAPVVFYMWQASKQFPNR